MRVLTVVGNRPQFVKAAAVSHKLRAVGEEVLIHTGQHYDDDLSRLFFEELEIPEPEHYLGLGGGSNTDQTARMLAALEPLMNEVEPDIVLVYGDTNSTLAGALVAAQRRTPVAHVEAGMRSFDRSMPEEINRVLTDQISDLLLCSSEMPANNLRKENAVGKIEVVGDVMVDIAVLVGPKLSKNNGLIAELKLEPGTFALVTAHRAGNVDDPARLEQLVHLLKSLPIPAVFPLHPRTRARLKKAQLLDELADQPHLHLTNPLGYLEFTSLLHQSKVVLTDSGGVQKEAYLAGIPCVTMRSTTEWVETVDVGWNVLVDLDAKAAIAALDRVPSNGRPELYGDGQAGERVVNALRMAV